MHDCISILAQKGIFTFTTWLKIKHNFQRKVKGIYCFIIKQNIFKRWLLKISHYFEGRKCAFHKLSICFGVISSWLKLSRWSTSTTEYQAILCCNALIFKPLSFGILLVTPLMLKETVELSPEQQKKITVLCFQWAHLYNLQLFFYKGTK